MAQAGTLLLVARLLGPQQFGAFAGIAALAVLLGSMSTFGMHLILLRELSKSQNRREAVLPVALGMTAIHGTMMLLLYLTIVWFGLRPTIGADIVLLIGLAELLLQPLLSLASMEEQAMGNTARSQLQANSPLFLRLAVAAVVWATQTANPLQAYAWGYLGASALALFLTRIHGSAWPPPGRWRLPRRAEWCDASGFAVLNLTAFGPTELDKTLALHLLPLGVAGVYSASARVAGASVLPIAAMVLAALPRLFREAGEHGNTRLLRWIFGTSLAYSITVGIALWLAAPLVEGLFGPKYDGIGEVLRWLTIAVPGMALRFAAGSALMTSGSPWSRAGIEALGLCVLCVMALVVNPEDTKLVMPIALACAEWSMAVSGWLLVSANPSHRRGTQET